MKINSVLQKRDGMWILVSSQQGYRAEGEGSPAPASSIMFRVESESLVYLRNHVWSLIKKHIQVKCFKIIENSSDQASIQSFFLSKCEQLLLQKGI